MPELWTWTTALGAARRRLVLGRLGVRRCPRRQGWNRFRGEIAPASYAIASRDCVNAVAVSAEFHGVPQLRASASSLRQSCAILRARARDELLLRPLSMKTVLRKRSPRRGGKEVVRRACYVEAGGSDWSYPDGLRGASLAARPRKVYRGTVAVRPSAGAQDTGGQPAITSSHAGPVSPRLPELDRIEGEDRLLDEIQGHAGDIACLFAIEPLARRIDQGEQHCAGLLQSPPLGFDSILKHNGRLGTALPALAAAKLCGSHDSAPHVCRVVVSRSSWLQPRRAALLRSLRTGCGGIGWGT